MKVWNSFLKVLHILVEYLFCKFSVFIGDSHIVLVADLEDDFIKRLFLITRNKFFRS
jgi:hypothetical protein